MPLAHVFFIYLDFADESEDKFEPSMKTCEPFIWDANTKCGRGRLHKTLCVCVCVFKYEFSLFITCRLVKFMK